ncbi:four helix bundle protein [Flaviaesturariibacter aridisoli]|uniref:Four helix bundle protein n=1 Tax=Flaviaesturariibacter aridisoli TaxID=2545761 RepID=A0A4R4DXE1_9BACT|nr:four helix bundle protein [Flaviaesturariibacter aridisoli]TCZ67896.1 four helix bundle protein [Flaviaesturariibacter aridisoli]
MPTIQNLEDVLVWQKARCLARKIYGLTFEPPLSLDFRLKDQMRGSCGAVMDNIAEGYGRGSQFEAVNSFSYSKGEAEELKSQLYRALDVGYISQGKFDELYADSKEIIRMLSSWIEYLNTTNIKGLKFKGR